MGLNYIKQLNAFYEWLQQNKIGPAAQSLYHILMMINNRCGWAEWFDRSNMSLADMMGVSENTMKSARDELKNAKLIDYKLPKKRNFSTSYNLRQLYAEAGGVSKSDTKVDTNIDTQVDTINKHKDKLKQDHITENQKPQKPSKPKPPPNPDHQKVMAHYYESFKTKFGEKPAISGGKDGMIIKNLLATYSAEKIITLLDKFFASTDSFIQSSGYTLGAFKSQTNKLLVSGGQTNAPSDPLAYKKNSYYKDLPGRKKLET